MIKAEVIADSKNKFGNRITTMIVTMPRIILAEFNTHRMFSRNSASSRAIPFEKMVESVKNNPFIPIAWQKDHKGMQGIHYLNEKYKDFITIEGTASSMNIIDIWLKARDKAVIMAKALSSRDCTKQLCNRLLEPFMWHTVIVTATEWENFFALRSPQYQIFDQRGINTFRSKKDAIKFAPDLLDNGIKAKPISDMDWLLLNKGQAEIHMMALAEAMWDAYNESTPKELKAGEWHIPFGDDLDNSKKFGLQLIKMAEELNVSKRSYKTILDWELELKVKIATARCARVSYTVVGEEGKEANYENDIKLHDRLAESGHWSPFEHCARAMGNNDEKTSNGVKLDHEYWSGNFKGFIQYRKMFDNENIK